MVLVDTNISSDREKSIAHDNDQKNCGSDGDIFNNIKEVNKLKWIIFNGLNGVVNTLQIDNNLI